MVPPPSASPQALICRAVADRNRIIEYLDGLLAIADFADYGPNGLQVPGAAEVSRVATGVSGNRELFEGAAATGAELVICHHGILWDFQPRMITPQVKARLEILFEHDISLAAYHLPLDAHAEVGNNALLCGVLGLERAEPFGQAKGRPIGWIGRSRDGLPAAELIARLGAKLGREPLLQGAGPERVHAVGVVSGAGAGTIGEAAALGLDMLLTGEPAEHAMADAAEAGMHFVAAGHYATETLGVQALGELVAEEFGVEHSFVEVPNPV
ncbi:MAG: Nif3-like dinuclear metal center hexameric protein [Thermoleophilaceae bacterium]|nr:Nif3-like dinuclear metal center hexameric protein [Thermoleophilaceae bacterium]